MFNRFKSIAKNLRRELKFYQFMLQDTRTPRVPKWLLGMAVAYVLLPFDLIPDFIPIIGHLDDVVLVPLLIFIALKMIPKEIIEDCRNKAKAS